MNFEQSCLLAALFSCLFRDLSSACAFFAAIFMSPKHIHVQNALGGDGLKKLKVIVCAAITFLALLLPFSAAIAEDPIVDSIDQKLQSTDPYYEKGSAAVMDFTDIIMDIAISEEEVEQQKVKMVFVKYQNERDTLFTFNKQEVFYYSLDNNELLENDAVIGNNESKKFFENHQDDYRKQISPVSLALILFLIFTATLVFPLFIILFNKNAPSDEMYHYEL
jgi:hypothetical protein